MAVLRPRHRGGLAAGAVGDGCAEIAGISGEVVGTSRVGSVGCCSVMVEGREQASIEEITKRAGVGFGSFFNHFPGGKEDLYTEAVMEALDAYADWVRSARGELDDPAEVFARSFRLTGRLAVAEPELLAPLLARGTGVLLVERGLRVVALEDLAAGVEGGRFASLDPEVHLVMVGGALLGLVRLLSTHPDRVDGTTIDEATASALRMLGVPADEAREIVARELPSLESFEVMGSG